MSVPPGPVTVNVTVYVPSAKYVYDGLLAVLVLPSPKFHELSVKEPVEEFEKVTTAGAMRLTGDSLKSAATGVYSITLKLLLTEATPLEAVTVMV